MTVVSAPGKAFLFGEYAVLEGAPAVVAAVDVRAFAWGRDAHEDAAHGDAFTPCEASPEVQAALACAHEALRRAGVTPPEGRPALDSRRFSPGERKLGFGSSAAVTVATVAWCFAQAGLSLDAPGRRDEIYALAREAHHRAQGGGSGGDIAAATYGGLRLLSPEGVEALALPAWLHAGFFDAGSPASTRAMIDAVKTAARERREDHARATAMLADASRTAVRGLSCTDTEEGFRALRSACSAHNEGLGALGALAGADILTPAIRGILDLAAEMGVAAKPSGAGGGDIVVAFASSRAALDAFRRAVWTRLKLRPLSEVCVGADGVRAETRRPPSSRVAGLYRQDVPTRQATVAHHARVAPDVLTSEGAPPFGLDAANHMIENVVGVMGLPVGVATNFTVNGEDVLVPMCVEEASVVAAASNAAKMIRAGGGFVAHSDPPWMIAQIQLVRGNEASMDADEVRGRIAAMRPQILGIADEAHPRLVARGGGAREVQVRILAPDTVVVHVLVDCRDAMGANLINTVAETVAPHLEDATGWNPCLRILSNLSDARASHVTAAVPPAALASSDWDGDLVARRIVEASRFAALDPYRATTHNKGIMNGVDAVVLATGNDWRAMEASAHAYAVREGRYGPLATWTRDSRGWLTGQMSLPTAIGVVGGATRSHPSARAALEILGEPNAARLGQIIASVGLASNLAALRALATEGIQRGHMGLHSRTIAIAAGAAPNEVPALARALVASGEVKLERARALLASIRAGIAEEHAKPPTGAT